MVIMKERGANDKEEEEESSSPPPLNLRFFIGVDWRKWGRINSLRDIPSPKKVR